MNFNALPFATICCAAIFVPGIATAFQPTILAHVDEESIYDYEVDRIVMSVAKRDVDPKMQGRLRDVALEKLIDQRVIVCYLRDHRQDIGLAQYQLSRNRIISEMKSNGITLSSFLSDSHRVEDEFRQSIWWEIAWRFVIERYRTDANLEKYFQRHRREFDGTQLRVSQIFFKLPKSADAEAIEGTVQYADSIRAKLADKQLSFGDAAKQYSQAPSAEQGGDIGWIERHRPMPSKFSAAAFKLSSGEVSPPVVTSLGVHLISVTDEKPGENKWSEVRAELEPAVDRYLFRWLADLGRKQCKIAVAVQPN